MILIEAVFSYCRFVRLGQSDVSFMLFNPKLDEPSALSNVHLAAFTVDLVRKFKNKNAKNIFTTFLCELTLALYCPKDNYKHYRCAMLKKPNNRCSREVLACTVMDMTFKSWSVHWTLNSVPEPIVAKLLMRLVTLI